MQNRDKSRDFEIYVSFPQHSRLIKRKKPGLAAGLFFAFELKRSIFGDDRRVVTAEAVVQPKLDGMDVVAGASDFERRIFSTVAAWLGIQLGDNVTIEWPKDFNLADMATEMATLQQAQASGLPGSYIRAKMKQIVSLDLGALEQGDADEIMDEIDAMATEVDQPASEGDDDRDQD